MSSSPPIALLNARLVDPERETETRGGLIVIDGVDRRRRRRGDARSAPAEARIVDCAGDVVAPGLIDMRAFIGEPGAEHRETIASASAGGGGGRRDDASSRAPTPARWSTSRRWSTSSCAARATTAKVRVLPCAALTKGLEGREIAEIGLLAEAGAVAFSDGPLSVANAQAMRRALTYARDFGALVMHYLRGSRLSPARA